MKFIALAMTIFCLTSSVLAQTFSDNFGTNATTRTSSSYVPQGPGPFYTFASPSGNNDEKQIENNHYAIVSPNYIWLSAGKPNLSFFWTLPPAGFDQPTNVFNPKPQTNDHGNTEKGGVLVINAGTTIAPFYKRKVTLNPGTYKITYWSFLVNQPQGGVPTKVGLDIWDGGTTPAWETDGTPKTTNYYGYLGGSEGVMTAEGAWQENTLIFTIPNETCFVSGKDIYLVLRNATSNPSGNDYYIDDISLATTSQTATLTISCPPPPVTISGKLVINTTANATANRTGVPPLVCYTCAAKYVTLVDANNVAITTVPIKSDGTYEIKLPANTIGNYTLVLTNDPNPTNKPSAPSNANWSNVGSNINGTTNSSTMTEIGTPVSSTNITNANFVVNYTGGDENMPLPVDFGNFTATVSNGQLVVNWTSLTETNNSYFEVQASKDGENFTTIGKVDTKATNGNSDAAIQYDFAAGASSAAGLLGLSVFALAFGALAFNRKNKILYTLAIVCGLTMFGAASCTKNDLGGADSGSSLFVRIKQVDKDGTFKYSKVVKATIE